MQVRHLFCWGYVVGFPLLLAVLLLDLPSAEDLYPRGDALEYGVTAASITRGEGFSIRLGNSAYYPPKFSPGFPILLSVFFRVFGVHLEYAYFVSLLFLCVSSVLVYEISRRLGNPLAGCFAVTVFALSPLTQSVSTKLMSDVCSTATVLLAFFFLVFALEKPSTTSRLYSLLSMAGVAAGWAVSVRLINLLNLFVILVSLAVVPWTSWAKRWVASIVVFFCGLVALIPTWYLNDQNFGTWKPLGYSLWSPEYCRNLASAYDLENLWRSMDPGKWPFSNGSRYLHLVSGWNLPGEKALLYGVPIWGFVAVLLVSLLRSEAKGRSIVSVFLVGSGLSCAVTVGHYLFYFWQDPRFLHLVVPWVAIWGGLGLDRLLVRWRDFSHRSILLTVAVLLVLGSLWPTANATITNLKEKYRHKSRTDKISEVRFLENLVVRIDPDSVIVSDCDCVLMETILVQGTNRLHIPLDLFHAGPHLFSIYLYNIPVSKWCREKYHGGSRPRPLYPPDDLGPSACSSFLENLKRGRPVYLVLRTLTLESSLIRRFLDDFHLESVEEGGGLVRVTASAPES